MRDLGPDPCQQKPAFGSVPAFAAKGREGGREGVLLRSRFQAVVVAEPVINLAPTPPTMETLSVFAATRLVASNWVFACIVAKNSCKIAT